MKLTVLFFFIACMQVSAEGNAQKITIQGNHLSLKTVFKQIKKQSGYTFFYSETDLKKAHSVNISARNQEVIDVIKQVFDDQPLSYNITGKTVVVKADPENIKEAGANGNSVDLLNEEESDQKVIGGKVTDDEGKPLVGVSVVIKGTNRGTTTNSTGDFSLEVEDNDRVLEFSMVGYVTAERTIGTNATINVSLSLTLGDMSEVIVVGYGTQKKRDITGAISSLNMDEIDNTPTKNVLSAMQGRIAGMQVVSNSGAPGDGISVVVRGQSTLNAGNDPLYVVDGIPIDATSFSDLDGHNSHGLNPLSYINPSDIQSIEVLKDAASTAIYGSRAANGVVMITTKKGKAGDAKLRLNAYTGISNLTRKLDVLNASEWRANVLDAYANLDKVNNATQPAERYFAIIDSLNPMNTGDVDWQDVMYRTAMQNQVELGVSGGSDKAVYSLSSSYLDQDGIFIGSNYKRITSRLNAEFTVKPRLKVGYNVMFSNEVNHRIDAGGSGNESLVRAILIRSPSFSLTYPDGSPINYFVGQRNPVGLAKEATFLNKQNRIIGQQYIEYKILDGLSIRSNLNIDYMSMKEDKFLPTTVDYREGYNVGQTRQSQFTNWSNENYINYNKEFQGGHEFYAMAGFSMQGYKFERTGLDGMYFASDKVITLNSAGTISNQEVNIANGHGMVSYYGRAGYNYKGKYIFQANMRADGSSRFGKNKRFGYFPSASAAWRISDENFLRGLNFLNDAKIRISAGQTGNEAIGLYDSQGEFAMGTNYLGNSGAAPTIMPNTNLSWETTTEYDLGIDLALFNNRILFTADAYIKNTSDLLFAVPIPETTGFAYVTQNVGKIGNKGLEFAVSTRNLTGEFQWNTNFNISLNRNRVKELPKDILTNGYIQNGTYHILKEGEPIGVFYGYKFGGVFIDDRDNVNGLRYSSSNGYLFGGGDPIWDDLNEDGIINAADRQIIGNAQPDFVGGFNNDFYYKGFSLSVFYQFSYGNDIYSIINQDRNSVNSYNNVSRAALDRWMKPGDMTNQPRPIRGDPFETDSRVSDRWIQNGSYLRLKNVRLSYSFSQNILNRLNFSRLMVYVSGENLLTWTNYTGYDPDVNSYSGLRLGLDAGSYPQSRTFIFGVNVEF